MEEKPAWVKCIVRSGDIARELLPLALIEWGAGGVEELGDAVAAWFPPLRREDVDGRLATFPAAGELLSWAWEPVPDEDWWESWKAYFHPLRVSSRLWLCPSWEVTEPPEAGMRTLLMDPGRAFGTGGHETTRLCLDVMDGEFAREPVGEFLDVGSGSGILTVGARLLGVERVVALDIDPIAAAATRENCLRNHVGENVRILCGDLRSLKGRYPFVTANILYQVILGLAPELKAHTAPGGRLLLSGFLDRETKGAEALFHRMGFSTLVRRTMGEWGALCLRLD